MNVTIANTDDELHKISSVLLQLRPSYTKESLIAQIQKQQANGYQLAYIEVDDKVVCVAGFVTFEKLAWKKCIYIDDLVTDENSRSKGAGKAMIDWFKQHAKETGCTQVHLDSGAHRKDAHRFYEREGFDNTGYHFAIAEL